MYGGSDFVRAGVAGGDGRPLDVQRPRPVLVGPRRSEQCDLQNAEVPEHAGGYACGGHASAGQPAGAFDADRLLLAQEQLGRVAAVVEHSGG